MEIIYIPEFVLLPHQYCKHYLSEFSELLFQKLHSAPFKLEVESVGFVQAVRERSRNKIVKYSVGW